MKYRIIIASPRKKYVEYFCNFILPLLYHIEYFIYLNVLVLLVIIIKRKLILLNMRRYQGFVITADPVYYYSASLAGRWVFDRDIQRGRLYGHDAFFSYWFPKPIVASGVKGIVRNLFENDESPLYVWSCSVVQNGDGCGVRRYAFGEKRDFRSHVDSGKRDCGQVIGSEWYGPGVRLDKFLRLQFIYQQRALRNFNR